MTGRRKIIPAFILLLLGLAGLHALEVQRHGVVFEEWVRDAFFDGYQPESYTQKWDIPAASNKRFGNIPANPKATKYGTAVDMGDALRQFDINEPFLLIIGYWTEEDGNKRFVKVIAPVVQPAVWRKLWGGITRPDLERLDAIIKNRTLTPEEARRQAQALKRQKPFTTAIITMNPKIDSESQRRLQCSLTFDAVFRYLAPDMDRKPEAQPRLFGVLVPGPFPSPPREFK